MGTLSPAMGSMLPLLLPTPPLWSTLLMPLPLLWSTLLSTPPLSTVELARCPTSPCPSRSRVSTGPPPSPRPSELTSPPSMTLPAPSTELTVAVLLSPTLVMSDMLLMPLHTMLWSPILLGNMLRILEKGLLRQNMASKKTVISKAQRLVSYFRSLFQTCYVVPLQIYDDKQ